MSTMKIKKAYCVFGYQCNNNCKICAVSSGERAKKEKISTNELVNFVLSLPEDIQILEISGGEPTVRNDFFEILERIKSRRPGLSYVLLTNGRRLSSRCFAERLSAYPIIHVIVALHSWKEEKHDWVTGARGSFRETIHGVRNALDAGMNVELKTIVTKANYTELERIASLVLSMFDDVKAFSFHALDITGNALRNAELFAVRMTDITENLSRAAEIVESSGLRVKFYGFPYCVLPEHLWRFVAPQPKTIYGYKSPTKQIINRRFEDNYGLLEPCEKCVMRSKCWGVWYSYIDYFGADEIVPITQ